MNDGETKTGLAADSPATGAGSPTPGEAAALSVSPRRFLLRWLCHPAPYLAAMVMLYLAWIGYILKEDKPIDFYLYYVAAGGFARGSDVYAMGVDYAEKGAEWAELAGLFGIKNFAPPYRYPPLTAEIVFPLTWLPPKVAAGVWLLASGAALGLAAWLLGGSSPLRYGRPLALVLMLLFVPALTTLHAGQVNAFVLLCLVIGMTALPQAPAGAGAAVAFAAMLKTVPLAHVLYLGWRRQTRAFLAAIVALFLLAVAAVPLVSTQGLSSFVRNLAAIGQPGHMFPVGSNQAVSGLIARILVSSGDVTAGTGSVPGYTMMWAASVAILTLITVLVCWPRGASSGLYRLEYGLVTVTVCLITPYTWYHQLVLLFIPFFVLIERALANSRSKWILAPIALAYVATDIHGLAWHHMRPHPFLVSLPSISALLIWLLLARSIVWEKLPDPEEPKDGANAWRLPSEGDN